MKFFSWKCRRDFIWMLLVALLSSCLLYSGFINKAHAGLNATLVWANETLLLNVKAQRQLAKENLYQLEKCINTIYGIENGNNESL